VFFFFFFEEELVIYSKNLSGEHTLRHIVI